MSVEEKARALLEALTAEDIARRRTTVGLQYKGAARRSMEKKRRAELASAQERVRQARIDLADEVRS